MIEIPINYCSWDKSSNTLTIPVSKMPTRPYAGGLWAQLCIVGKEFDIQFFWDAERKWYKFDKILTDKRDPPGGVLHESILDIVLMIDVNN